MYSVHNYISPVFTNLESGITRYLDRNTHWGTTIIQTIRTDLGIQIDKIGGLQLIFYNPRHKLFNQFNDYINTTVRNMAHNRESKIYWAIVWHGF